MPLDFQDRTDAEFTNRTDTEWNKQITLSVQGSASGSASGTTSLIQQKHLVCQDTNSASQIGAAVLSVQKTLALNQTNSTTNAGIPALSGQQILSLAQTKSITVLGALLVSQCHRITLAGESSATTIGQCSIVQGQRLVLLGTASLSTSGALSLQGQETLAASQETSISKAGTVALTQAQSLIVANGNSVTKFDTPAINRGQDLVIQGGTSLTTSGMAVLKQAHVLSVNGGLSQAFVGQLSLEESDDLAFVDTEYTSFQDQSGTVWAGTRNTITPNGNTSACFLGPVILTSYFFASEVTSQTDMGGADWRYLQAADGTYILTGDGSKIVINQGLTQVHNLTVQNSASATNTTVVVFTTEVIALSVSDCASLTKVQGSIAQQHILTVQNGASLTTLPSTVVPSIHTLAISNPISVTVSEALLMQSSQNLTINEIASAIVDDSVRGSVTSSNILLSLADEVAFCDFSLAGSLTPYVINKIEIVDNSGKKCIGFTKEAGTIITYGSEIITSWSTWSPGGYSILTRSGSTITTAVSNGGMIAGTSSDNFGPSISQGILYEFVANISVVNGQPPFLQNWESKDDTYPWNWWRPSSAGQWGMIPLVDGINVLHITVPWDLLYYYPHLQLRNSESAHWGGTFSFRQMLSPSSTGVAITSTLGGSVYNWAVIEAGFNYNDSLGYTYLIEQTRIYQSQQLALQDSSSTSQAEYIYTEDHPILTMDEQASSSVSEAVLISQDHVIDISNIASVTTASSLGLEVREKDIELSGMASSSGLNALDLVKQGSLVLQDAVSPSQIEGFGIHKTINLIAQNSISVSDTGEPEFTIEYAEIDELKSTSRSNVIDLTQCHTLALSDSKSVTTTENATVDPYLWGDLNITFIGMGSEVRFHGHASKAEFTSTHSEVLFKSKRGIYK